MGKLRLNVVVAIVEKINSENDYEQVEVLLTEQQYESEMLDHLILSAVGKGYVRTMIYRYYHGELCEKWSDGVYNIGPHMFGDIIDVTGIDWS